MFEKNMRENFPNIERGKGMQVQGAQRVPIMINIKSPTSRHIIIKLLNFEDKERILKAAQEKKEVTYKGAYNKANS